jgi:hypothetical protein
MTSHRSSDEDQSTIIRRKFTLTESLDSQVERLADQHYQGNVSLCLRAAIKEHQQTLSGEGRLALKRLEREINNLNDTVSNLNPDIADVVAEIEECRPASEHDGLPSISSERFEITQEVLEGLHEAETSLRVEDLAERVEAPPRLVIPALGQLVDLGFVVKTPRDERYQCIMNSPR